MKCCIQVNGWGNFKRDVVISLRYGRARSGSTVFDDVHVSKKDEDKNGKKQQHEEARGEMAGWMGEEWNAFAMGVQCEWALQWE